MIDTAPPPAAPPSTQPPGAPPDTTPPPSQPWHASLFADESGKFASDWTQKLPDSLAEYRAMAAQYPDLPTFLKSHRDNMAAARAKGLKLPGEHATPEERTAFDAELRKVRGAPDTPDAYEIPQPEGLPEGLDWKQATAEFRTLAHEIGLTPKEAERIAQFDLSRQAAAQQAMQAQKAQIIAEEQAAMKARWGDNAGQVLRQAQHAAAEFLPPESFDPTSDSFLGIAAVEAIAKLAAKSQPAGHVIAPAAMNLTGEDLARDIMTNPAHPDYKAYNDASHPQSAAVRARVADLWKRSK